MQTETNDWKPLQSAIEEYNKREDKLIELTEGMVVSFLNREDISTTKSRKFIKGNVDLNQLVLMNVARKSQNKIEGYQTKKNNRDTRQIIDRCLFYTLNILLSNENVSIRIEGKMKKFRILEDTTKLINGLLSQNQLATITGQDIIEYLNKYEIKINEQPDQ